VPTTTAYILPTAHPVCRVVVVKEEEEGEELEGGGWNRAKGKRNTSVSLLAHVSEVCLNNSVYVHVSRMCHKCVALA